MQPIPKRGRPRTGRVRTKQLKDGRVAFYARFTDQHGVRHEPLLGYSPDWNMARAESELDNIMADVRRGIWRPPLPEHIQLEEDPLFLDFASDWWASKRKEGLAERTHEWWEWGLKDHLLPFLATFRLSQFNARLVDRFRDHLLDKRFPEYVLGPDGKPRANKNGEPRRHPKAGQQRLQPRQVNAVLSMLAAILDVAEEYELIDSNPARSKRRRAKVPKRAKVGTWLDYDQLVALLDAAQELDFGAARAANRHLGRRALLACLFLAALRISEATALQRKDVNWNRGTIRVVDSKTPAGFRDVPMHRMLFDVMREWWERHPNPHPSALLFPSAAGTARDRNNARNRVLNPAKEHGAELLASRGQDPMPQKFATHAGRRTAITWWAEAGYDEAQVMAWVGHEDAALTLRIYRQVRHRPDDTRVKAAMSEVPAAERRPLRKAA
jgi:integrase